MKRFSALATSLIMIFTVLQVGAGSLAVSTASNDADDVLTPSDVIDAAEEIELTQAARFGLPTEKIGQRTLSGREFMEIADAFVAFAAQDKLNEWKNEFKVMREVDEPIYRADAMVVIYYAGQIIGGKYAGITTEYSNESAWVRTDIEAHHPDSYCNYNWLDGYAITHGPSGDEWMVGNAVDYNLNHWSPISGRNPFYHNPDNNSFDFDILPSYADGVLAIIRVITSGNPEVFDDLFPKNVRDPGIFDEQINEKIALYPKVTPETMPRWTGHILGNVEGTFHSDMVQYIRDVKEWGFNAVRVRLDVTYAMDENVEHLDNNLYLLVLDQMIAEAIKQGIHLELVCNYAPGRWLKTISQGNYLITTTFDHLYGDKRYQDLTDELWRTIIARYKGIPNACLTILPMQEMYYNYVGEGDFQGENIDRIDYTPQDVANYQAHLIDVIHEVDPNRIVLFEPDPIHIFYESTGRLIVNAMKGKPNTLITFNLAQIGAWGYFGMNFNKADPDRYHHSTPIPRYPYCGYEAHEVITKNYPITIGGFLPAGTEITVNLRKLELFDADFESVLFRILADGAVLYSEDLFPCEYNVGDYMSGHMPYSESDKQITVKLTEDTDSVVMDIGSDRDYGFLIYNAVKLYWSGIKVHLPEEYAVDQFWNASEYDISLGIADVDQPGIYIKHTSDVLIAPSPLQLEYNESYWTHDFTINKNVTYSTPYKCEETSRDVFTATIKDSVENYYAGWPASIRTETFFGYDGKLWEDYKQYLIDQYDAITADGLSWWSNDSFYCRFAEGAWMVQYVYGMEPVKNGRYEVFYPELLEIHQRYMAPGWCEFSAETEGQGSVVGSQMIIAGNSATLNAIPDDGAEFLGWYIDGEFVSAEPSYSTTVNGDMRLVAKFTPKYLSGDVNGSGNVTLDDAVLTLKRAMNVDIGEDTFIEQAADVVTDGKITLDDAVEILKIAMKIL